MPEDLITGDDGVPRCGWGADPDVYRRYHDDEWGRPLHGERELYGLLTLETFQSGLSWLTILRKRPAFEAAFHGFDPERVAGYGEEDTARLLADAGIVRNRLKVAAAITNARATVALRADGGLDAFLWSFAEAASAERTGRPERLADVPSATPTSKALAKALRGRGFAFVGPTVAYAFMQSMGLVDDHLIGCACAGRERPARGTAGAVA
ncbi:DNA-3-methyladenine glycosylase I [Patulibacter sp. SYSU D01012]|uniref:DNA-3-methyladenine glycosylase I n=1 Tax=Patulibacter sp. SYSU D01012 TaxID=2817381 RepID=UPI001B30E0F4|nr:DNA-3-methyladenine glycosylase I [Patulibacter sp. SYSU D01012]